jgi:DNA-directed RNA polymerase I, II, and III subunit RPABC2
VYILLYPGYAYLVCAQLCQDDNYDLLANEGQEGEGGEGVGEDGMPLNGEVSHEGVNGVEGDQDMVNGEEPATGAGITGERQPNKERITTPYLTKYERARILGTRALQIRYVYRLPLSYSPL